jgi:peptidoglycan/xylan/chitin deacetylase (PgdA/CDA1 family)
MRRAAFLLLLASFPTLLAGQDKTFCVNIDYSAVPALVNDRKLTINVDVGTCSGVSVTADGHWIAATYNTSTHAAAVNTSGSALAITALNWTTGGTGAATKATLYNNYHWAFSQTFDDTRQSQYDYAKPILDALGWKAGIAAVGSWVQSGNNYYMTWTEVKALLADGWQVYNHTWDHPNPVSCANFPTEFDQNQTALLAQLPGYNVSHVVYPYEVSTATCAGWPPNYVLSGELGGSGYTHIDAALPNVYTVVRNGLYGTDPTGIQNTASQAAADSRPSWMVCITHSVSQGSGAAADQYSTNQAALNTLYSFLGNNYGAAGNKSMWFAPSGEVQDFLFTRDKAVVSTCTAPTATFTPLRASSATQTMSPSASPSATAEPSGTKTATASPSPSCTITPSRSVTATLSGTASSSASPTLSATAEPSGTRTGTASSTPVSASTDTASSTPSPSGTRTGTATVAVPSSATPTATPTLSVTQSASATPSSTGTATPALSATGSGSATPGFTGTFTPTASATPTPSATAEPSATASSSATATPTRSATPTPSATAEPSATASFTPQSTSSPSVTALPGSGPLSILQALPYPNPGPQEVRMKLSADADYAIVRVWSRALVQMAQVQAGPQPRGWSSLALPASFSHGAANGVYFLTLEAWKNGQKCTTKPLKCLILH